MQSLLPCIGGQHCFTTATIRSFGHFENFNCYRCCIVKWQFGVDFLSLQKLLAAILLQKKSIMQELAANILMIISHVKIVGERFLP